MSSRVVYFNGRFVPECEARVSIYDSALQFGDMAFEVTRTVRGRPYRLEEHLLRLRHSLSAMQVDAGLDDAALDAATRETLARNVPSEPDDVDWQIVHNVSRGPLPAYSGAFAADELRPTVIVACYPLTERMARLAPAYESGWELVVPPQRSIPADLLDPRLKTRSRLHYQIANLQTEAMRPGAVAALLDADGFLTEGTNGNLFLVRRGKLLTPRPRDILLGVTRGAVLELAGQLGLAPAEEDLTPQDARDCDEMFVTSTSVGIVHAHSFEGSVLADGRAGPVTRQLRAAFFASVGLDFAEQARGYVRRLGWPI